MSIGAGEKDVKFLEAYKFIIPYFQRRYVWKKRNWREFYNNFFENSKPGFIGSIILKKQQTSTLDGYEKIDVIDGQQRLTTLTLFLKALYETMEEKDKKGFKNTFNNIFYNKIEQNNDYIDEPRLELSYLDRNSFNNVLFNKIDCTKLHDIENENEDNEYIEYNIDDEEISDGYDGIIECYNYFYKRMLKESGENKKNLAKALFNNNAKFYVEISIDSDDDEQKVFDTLNTAGVKLTMADTIKNYLFNKVSKIVNGDEKKIKKIYNDTWKKTFEKDDENEIEKDSKWNKEIVTGRISRTNIDLFLYSYAVIKGIYVTKDNIDKLTNIYKKYIDDNTNKIKEILSDLCEYANIFFQYFMNDNFEKDYKYSKEVEDILDRLLLMKNTTFYPYILYVLVKYKNDNSSLKEELHNIEKLIFTNIIYGNANKSKNYNKLSQQFIKNDGGVNKELESLDTYFPKGLFSISNEQAKTLLFIIELYRRKDEMTDIKKIQFSKDFQLEHIMPQKWQKNWSDNLPTQNDDGIKFQNEDDQKRYRKEKIYALGNMTILSGALNNKIKNSALDIKIEGNNDECGIKKYSTLLIARKDVVEYYNEQKMKNINVNEIWNEKRINKRTWNLYKELKEAVLY